MSLDEWEARNVRALMEQQLLAEEIIELQNQLKRSHLRTQQEMINAATEHSLRVQMEKRISDIQRRCPHTKVGFHRGKYFGEPISECDLCGYMYASADKSIRFKDIGPF